jgi:cystathionine beta-lyase family protein involved in aluminum resistance
MSIAIDEAEKKYPRDVALTATSENNTCRITGYIAGRTAEPTEEEVKAVADELAAWNFDVAMNSGATIHGASADFSSRSFELLAKRILNAARKAVSE